MERFGLASLIDEHLFGDEASFRTLIHGISLEQRRTATSSLWASAAATHHARTRAPMGYEVRTMPAGARVPQSKWRAGRRHGPFVKSLLIIASLMAERHYGQHYHPQPR